jgi:hypothetical protein
MEPKKTTSKSSVFRAFDEDDEDTYVPGETDRRMHGRAPNGHRTDAMMSVNDGNGFGYLSQCESSCTSQQHKNITSHTKQRRNRVRSCRH